MMVQFGTVGSLYALCPSIHSIHQFIQFSTRKGMPREAPAASTKKRSVTRSGSRSKRTCNARRTNAWTTASGCAKTQYKWNQIGQSCPGLAENVWRCMKNIKPFVMQFIQDISQHQLNMQNPHPTQTVIPGLFYLRPIRNPFLICHSCSLGPTCIICLHIIFPSNEPLRGFQQ